MLVERFQLVGWVRLIHPTGRAPEAVIARSEATKQSILSLRGEMDCFAEPVIGRAFARPVGSQ